MKQNISMSKMAGLMHSKPKLMPLLVLMLVAIAQMTTNCQSTLSSMVCVVNR